MTQHSLIIAVTIGAAFAALLGVVLEFYYTDEIILRTDGAAITLVLEKNDHNTNNNITVTLHNSGISPVLFETNSFYGLRVTQLDGILVYTPMGDSNSLSLDVGQSVIFVWDKLKANGEHVHNGIYRILAEGLSTEDELLRDTVTVNIL